MLITSEIITVLRHLNGFGGYAAIQLHGYVARRLFRFLVKSAWPPRRVATVL